MKLAAKTVKSNLARAELGRKTSDYPYEDLNFAAKQAVEKTMKRQ